MLDFIAYADGRNDLIDISNRPKFYPSEYNRYGKLLRSAIKHLHYRGEYSCNWGRNFLMANKEGVYDNDERRNLKRIAADFSGCF